jgi:hypothetical protein
MARAKCLISIDGVLVMTSTVTGRRYQFTRRQRALEIDDCDVQQFDAKQIKVSKCGCRGGQGVQDTTIKVFEID